MVGFIFVLVIGFLLAPSVSSAATWEYITHGGYDAAVNAWKRVALIFSDNAYLGLFISAAVLGALILYISVVARAAMGARGVFSSWVIPVMVGSVLYVATILPRDSIVIYDETLNRGPYRVDNIPRGIATLAGIMNKIEDNLVDLVSVSSSPLSDYRVNVGGTGFRILDYVDPDQIGASVQASVARYIKDCVYLAIQRPNSPLSVDKIKTGEQDAAYIIANSRSPSVYTVYYTPENSAGITMTCEEAGNRLLGEVSPTSEEIKKLTLNACIKAGFDPNSSQSIDNCRSLMNAVVSELTNGSGNGDKWVIQSVVASQLQRVILEESPTEAIKVLATHTTQSSFVGFAAHAGTWIPILKETLSAVAVAIVPLVALAIPTPLVGKAFAILAGMFTWVTVWGVVDAVLHSFGMELAMQASEALSVGGSKALGIFFITMYPSVSLKIAASFGAIRWAGLMLSSIITAMFIRFGGTALAMLAGTISSMPQSSGGAMGQEASTGFHGVLSGRVLPMRTWANAASWFGTSGLIEGHSVKSGAEMAAGAGVAYRVGGDVIYRANEGNLLYGIAQGVGAKNVIDSVGFDRTVQGLTNTFSRGVHYGIGLGSPAIAATVGLYLGQKEAGVTDQKLKMMHALGFNSVEKFEAFEAGGRIATKEVLPYLHRAGFTGVTEGMKVDYGVDTQGRLLYLTGALSDGSQYVRYEGNQLVTKAIMSGNELRPLEMELRQAGFTNIANSLNKVISSNTPVDVTVVRDARTNDITTVTIGRIGTFTRKDFSSSETGWENIKKAFNRTILGSHTEVYHGSQDHHVGVRWNVGNDAVLSIVTGGYKLLHSRYGPLMWTHQEAGVNIVNKFVDELKKFGDLQGTLLKAAQAGITIRAGGIIGKALTAAGVELSASGEIRSVDRFDVDQFRVALIEEYKKLYDMRDISMEKRTDIIGKALHDGYNMFKELHEMSIVDRLVGKKRDTDSDFRDVTFGH